VLVDPLSKKQYYTQDTHSQCVMNNVLVLPLHLTNHKNENDMVKTMDISKNALLKSELKTKYADLTDAEMNQINNSFDQFVESISLKTLQQKENVAREVETSVDYAKSKTL
jgi:hypothetical protein